MLKRAPGILLTDWQRSILHWPMLYRLRWHDYFLPAFFLAGMVMLGGSRLFALSGVNARLLLLAGFAVVIISLNRSAFLLAGRGTVKLRRVTQVLELLTREGRLELIPFCLKTRIPYSTVCAALDRMMAENFYLGYLNRRKLELVITDEPDPSGTCPVCEIPLSQKSRREQRCSGCGTVFYS